MKKMESAENKSSDNRNVVEKEQVQLKKDWNVKFICYSYLADNTQSALDFCIIARQPMLLHHSEGSD